MCSAGRRRCRAKIACHRSGAACLCAVNAARVLSHQVSQVSHVRGAAFSWTALCATKNAALIELLTSRFTHAYLARCLSALSGPCSLADFCAVRLSARLAVPSDHSYKLDVDQKDRLTRTRVEHIRILLGFFLEELFLIGLVCSSLFFPSFPSSIKLWDDGS